MWACFINAVTLWSINTVMADEKSCGAMVYTYENGVRKYVIIRGMGIYKEFCSKIMMMLYPLMEYLDQTV